MRSVWPHLWHLAHWELTRWKIGSQPAFVCREQRACRLIPLSPCPPLESKFPFIVSLASSAMGVTRFELDILIPSFFGHLCLEKSSGEFKDSAYLKLLSEQIKVLLHPGLCFYKLFTWPLSAFLHMVCTNQGSSWNVISWNALGEHTHCNSNRGRL